MNSTQGKRRADEGPSQPNVQEGPTPKRDCVKTNTITKDKVCMKELKDCMDRVYLKLQVKQCSKEQEAHIDLLKEKYKKLEGAGKEKVVVGLLGKTGAGKSSLLNAVLGIPKLLPSGNIGACTSVIITVVANTSPEFVAEVEFVSKEEWETELEFLLEVISDQDKDRQMVDMAKSKIRALYGNDKLGKNLQELLKIQTFNELFSSGQKTLSSQSASELSTSISCYIRSKSRAAEKTTSYWPIVKSVTIKVPNAPDFMEYIELVDIPGAGDWNSARDAMWESYISKCSAVWIVTEINRCGSENEAWSILDSATLGNGGQCHTITFICTKTDNTSKSDWEDEELDTEKQDLSSLEPKQIEDLKKRAFILRCNEEAKMEIEEKIIDWNFIKILKKTGIKVHTVSSEEFHQKEILTEKETEIPDLRKLLGKLNDQQSEKLTKRYITVAHAILSKIHSANFKMTETCEEGKKKVKKILTQRLEEELTHICTFMSDVHEEFRKLLSEVSNESCLDCAIKDVIKPEKDNRGYHQTLRAVCKGKGFCRSKQGDIKDLNGSLAGPLYEAIDNRFTEIFPIEGNAKPSINFKINAFNITSKGPVPEEYNLPQLTEHIKTEQRIVKEKLLDDIIQKKKEIYSSLKRSITETMQPAYIEAASKRGIGSMRKMQDVLEAHIKSSEDTMLSTAQRTMLNCLNKMKCDIHDELKSELRGAINQALRTQTNLSTINVSKEYVRFKNLYDKLVYPNTDTLQQSPCLPSQTHSTAPQVSFLNEDEVIASQKHLTGNKFVDKFRSKLIQRVTMVMGIADDLLEKEMIQPEMYSEIEAESTTMKQMRKLYKVVQSAGAETKTAFYNSLEKYESPLLRSLQ